MQRFDEHCFSEITHLKKKERGGSHNSRFFNSLVQRLDSPRFFDNQRTIRDTSRTLALVHAATCEEQQRLHCESGNGRFHWRLLRGEDTWSYMSDSAHTAICPPCASRPLSLLPVISRGLAVAVRPCDETTHTMWFFSHGRKSVACRRAWERRFSVYVRAAATNEESTGRDTKRWTKEEDREIATSPRVGHADEYRYSCRRWSVSRGPWPVT